MVKKQLKYLGILTHAGEREEKENFPAFQELLSSDMGPKIWRLGKSLDGKEPPTLFTSSEVLKVLTPLQDRAEKGRKQSAVVHEVWCGAGHAWERELCTIWAKETLLSCGALSLDPWSRWGL